MSSLTAHLRLPEDHSGLPFHPSCPVCRRDRLAGSLDGEEMVSRRAQAAIAAGLLAFSGLGVPVAAAASELDSTSEGAAEVMDAVEQAVSPELDLELETAQLPDDATAPDPVVAGTDEDSGPLEVEPVADVREPAIEVADSAPAPPAATVDPVAPEQPAVATPPAEAAAPSAPEESGITAQATQPRQTLKAEAAHERRPEPQIVAPAPAPSVQAAEATPAAAPPAPAVEPAPSSTVRAVARSRGSRAAAPGDRFHVVRPGESLWSIAADLLGDRATVPRIAREANRLWELNDERIRTGDPNLLYAGTRLVVR